MGAARDLIFTILGIDKGSDALDKVGKSADKTADRLENFGKVSKQALGGTVAAATAAGVGIGGALAGTAVAFGALGLVAAAANDQVSASYGDLWQEIKRGTREAAEPLTADLLSISSQAESTFEKIRPELRGLFSDSMPAVHALVDGVTGFITETMPGLETAIDHSREPAEALRDVMIDTGRGVTTFFSEISTASESSSRIIRDFGSIVEQALGFAGSMLARLSNEGAPAVHRLSEVFTQLTGTVTQLSSGALPILFGSAGIALNIFSGLISLVGGLQGVLGPLTGVALSTGAALKLIDTVTFGGVSAQFGNLKKAIGEAEGAGGKLKAGVTGLVGGFGPMGLAAIGVGLALTGLGNAQEKAAREAAAHQQRIQELTDALRNSNGAVDDSVRALAAKHLAETQVTDTGKSVLEVARESGIALNVLTDAYLGNAGAQQVVTEALGEFAKVHSDEVNGMSAEASAAYDLQQLLPGLNSEYSTSAQKVKDIAQAQGIAAKATDQHSAALIHLEEVLLGFVNKDLAYRQAVSGEREAVDNVTDAVRKKAEADAKVAEAVAKHGAKSKEAAQAIQQQKQAADAITSANFGWEESEVRLVAAAGEKAAAQYRGRDAAEAARLKMDAENKEIIRLAELAGNAAPPALRQLIGGMDRTQLAALGASVKVNDLGQTVVRLPSGKEIVLTAADLASPTIQHLQGTLATLRDKTITLTVVQRQIGLKEAQYGDFPGRAGGGPVKAGLPYIVGEQGPELLFPQADGWVATASETRSMMSGGYQSVAGGAAGSVVLEFRSGGSRMEDLLLELFRNAVRVRGGDVQAVLGSR